jgi:hypothetical protein
MAYAVGPQAGHFRGNKSLSRLYGAGLTVRKSALDELNARGFSPMLSGRVGTALSAGDDSELCYALALAGWDLDYDRHLVFEHVIPAKRLSETYLVDLYKGFGASSAALDLYVWISFRRRRNPIELAVTCGIVGTLTSFTKLLYWFLRCVIIRPLDSDKRLEARVRFAYFVYRFEAFFGGWAAACRHAKAVSDTFLSRPSRSRSASE